MGSVPGHRTLLKRGILESYIALVPFTPGRTLLSGSIEPIAERFELPCAYGDELRYSSQYVLIAAVALVEASVVTEGRSYTPRFCQAPV